MTRLKGDADTDAARASVYRVTASEILGFVERIESLTAEKQQAADCIAEAFAEAKARGYDIAALRKVIARRKDPQATSEMDAVIQIYEEAINSGAES